MHFQDVECRVGVGRRGGCQDLSDVEAEAVIPRRRLIFSYHFPFIRYLS